MALQFYSNENFSIVMVNLLKAVGHDVLTSYEAGQANQRIPDGQVLRYATATHRILITENRQDFIDLHRITLDHSGIIIFRSDRDYTVKIRAMSTPPLPPESPSTSPTSASTFSANGPARPQSAKI